MARDQKPSWMTNETIPLDIKEALVLIDQASHTLFNTKVQQDKWAQIKENIFPTLSDNEKFLSSKIRVNIQDMQKVSDFIKPILSGIKSEESIEDILGDIEKNIHKNDKKISASNKDLSELLSEMESEIKAKDRVGLEKFVESLSDADFKKLKAQKEQKEKNVKAFKESLLTSAGKVQPAEAKPLVAAAETIPQRKFVKGDYTHLKENTRDVTFTRSFEQIKEKSKALNKEKNTSSIMPKPLPKIKNPRK